MLFHICSESRTRIFQLVSKLGSFFFRVYETWLLFERTASLDTQIDSWPFEVQCGRLLASSNMGAPYRIILGRYMLRCRIDLSWITQQAMMACAHVIHW